MATVFVIDDDPAVCESLRTMVEGVGLQCRAFASAEDFLTALPVERPCCLLLDIVLSGMSGLELQQILLDRGHELPVVMITAHADVPRTIKAMEAGAVTLLEKPCSEAALGAAIARAIECDKRQLETERRVHSIGMSVSALTMREQTILQEILKGTPNKAIASLLNVSERTVEGDRAKIITKFESDNAVEVAAKYTEFRVLSAGKNRYGVRGHHLKDRRPQSTDIGAHQP